MKKLLTSLVILMLVFCFSSANAQMGFGLLGGINLANIYGDDVDDALSEELDNYLGIAAGGALIAPLSNNLSFRVELLYSQKGAKMSDEILDEGIIFDIEGTVYGAYLEVPVLLQISFPSNGITPFIIAGPYVAYNLSAKTKIEISADLPGVGDFSEDEEEDIKDDVKDIDYGIVVGAGILINDRFEISARYSMGLASFDDTDNDFDMKNKAIQIFAGLFL